LIIFVVVVINVIVTLPPSNDVHGVCHGATAGRGANNDANLAAVVADAAAFFAPAILSSCWRGKNWGETEDNAQVVAVVRPSSWWRCPKKLT
jgi:hypothetical protein